MWATVMHSAPIKLKSLRNKGISVKVAAETEWSPLRVDFFLVRTYYNKRNPRTTAIESNLHTLPPERRIIH